MIEAFAIQTMTNGLSFLEKNLGLYKNFYRTVVLYLKLESYSQFVAKVTDDWFQAVQNGSQDWELECGLRWMLFGPEPMGLIENNTKKSASVVLAYSNNDIQVTVQAVGAALAMTGQLSEQQINSIEPYADINEILSTWELSRELMDQYSMEYFDASQIPPKLELRDPVLCPLPITYKEMVQVYYNRICPN